MWRRRDLTNKFFKYKGTQRTAVCSLEWGRTQKWYCVRFGAGQHFTCIVGGVRHFEISRPQGYGNNWNVCGEVVCFSVFFSTLIIDSHVLRNWNKKEAQSHFLNYGNEDQMRKKKWTTNLCQLESASCRSALPPPAFCTISSCLRREKQLGLTAVASSINPAPPQAFWAVMSNDGWIQKSPRNMETNSLAPPRFAYTWDLMSL